MGVVSVGRYWHEADILAAAINAAFGGKADIARMCGYAR
jgi:hypothetical protein